MIITLKQRCLEMPYRYRLNLCAALQESILQERMDGKKPVCSRGDILLEMMGEILGEPVDLKSRDARFVWARTMVTYQLLQEGFSTMEAGRMIGKDHSTVINMRMRMQDALDLPQAYKDIINIWKQFKEKIDHDILERTTENLISLGGEFPDCSQGEMGEESGEDCPPGDL